MTAKKESILAKIINLNAIRRRCAERMLKSNLSSINPEAIEGEDFSKHFADEETTDLGLQYVIKSFIISRIRFIQENIGKGEFENSVFADIGDSSGIFLKVFNKKGIGVNISKEAVINIKAKDIDSVRADVGNLPFKDGVFDNILFFEIFEHVPNPIETLKELNRVCKKSVFLAIPYVSRTNIYEYKRNPEIPLFQNHIFEFSNDDFKKIVSHGGFKVHKEKKVDVFDCGINLIDTFIFTMWKLFRERDMFCGCFTNFSIYHLTKR